MTAILIFTICGKTVSFITWHTTEMDSAQNFHIKTTNEVLFLKNAYRSLSSTIFQFLVLTKYALLYRKMKLLLFRYDMIIIFNNNKRHPSLRT